MTRPRTEDRTAQVGLAWACGHAVGRDLPRQVIVRLTSENGESVISISLIEQDSSEA